MLAEKIENSIFTQYRESIWEPFLNALERYSLVEDGDRIAVCISGGKDSMLMAKLMELYKRQGSVDFDLVYLVMNPGYNEENYSRILENAKILNIPLTVFESNIFDVAYSSEKSPCYLCARMRRGHLYAKAKELNCNKIALGHHLSDVIETIALSMFYASQLQGMLPKLASTNFEGMELIRPLYCINAEDIISWCEYNGLEFIRCACRFTEQYHSADDDIGASKRQEVKYLIKELKKDIPGIEKSIFESLHNLKLDTMIEYKQENEIINFLDRRNK